MPPKPTTTVVYNRLMKVEADLAVVHQVVDEVRKRSLRIKPTLNLQTAVTAVGGNVTTLTTNLATVDGNVNPLTTTSPVFRRT